MLPAKGALLEEEGGCSTWSEASAWCGRKASRLLGVSAAMEKRGLNRCPRLRAEELADLRLGVNPPHLITLRTAS
jgi:hypothetical protein